ncbi:MAG: hypothetical protein ACREFO_18980 [Acetobacteraceae bacterium]
MSVKVELPPEIEANLAAQASAQGIPLPEYLRHLLEERASVSAGNPLSPEERATAWRQSVRDLPDTRPLSDAAISRESIYTARG